MSIFELFKPEPYREEIQDQDLIRKRYRHWRLQIFLSIYVGYMAFYFSRKSFIFVMPAIMADLHLDKSQLGAVSSVLAITYGISKFVSGIVSDRSNARYFMGLGLILTGIFNICFGFSSSVILFTIFWGLNGWFQGWGMPPIIKLLTHWYSNSERGRWWSVWNTSLNLGGALIPLFATWCVGFGSIFGFSSWQIGMFGPGVVCIIIGILLTRVLRDTPQSLGLPAIEKYRNDYSTRQLEKEKERLPVKEILFKYVLNNRTIWLLAISYFFVYIVRQAINDWTALYLIETKGYSFAIANGCVMTFEIGGLMGALASGWVSDKLFNARRNPVSILFMAGMIVLTAAFLFFQASSSPVLDSILIFLSGFFIFGPQMLIGIACTELSHKKAAGTANGFAGTFAYFGAAVAGQPLGYLIDAHGWSVFHWALGICAFIGFLLLVPMWKQRVDASRTVPA